MKVAWKPNMGYWVGYIFANIHSILKEDTLIDCSIDSPPPCIKIRKKIIFFHFL